MRSVRVLTLTAILVLPAGCEPADPALLETVVVHPPEPPADEEAA